MLAVGALVQLIRGVAPSLRSLALVSGSIQPDDVRPFLREIGLAVHHLALFLPGLCDVREHTRDGRSPGYGVLLQPMTTRMVHARQQGDPRLYWRFEGAGDGGNGAAGNVGADGPAGTSAAEPAEPPELPADLHADIDEEMETDMLQNAAQGLCVTLLEPSRVLAHLPGWGKVARRQCKAALAPMLWLR